MVSSWGQKPRLIKRAGGWWKGVWGAVAPGRRAWRGAAWGALVALITILLRTAHGLFGQAAPVWLVLGAAFLLALFALAGGLLTVVWQILRGIPTFYLWVLTTAVLAFAHLALTALSVPVGIVTVGLGTLAVGSLLGGRGGQRWRAEDGMRHRACNESSPSPGWCLG